MLYAPTFRGRGRGEARRPGLDAAAPRARRCPPDHALVLKTHPNLDPSRHATAGFDVVADPASRDERLAGAADILITDYSSSIFEWAVLRRPLVLLVADLEAYERDPGLYLDYRTEMIGTQVTDTDGVVAAILAGRVRPVRLRRVHRPPRRWPTAGPARASSTDSWRAGARRRGDTLPRDVRHE